MISGEGEVVGSSLGGFNPEFRSSTSLDSGWSAGCCSSCFVISEMSAFGCCLSGLLIFGFGLMAAPSVLDAGASFGWSLVWGFLAGFFKLIVSLSDLARNALGELLGSPF